MRRKIFTVIIIFILTIFASSAWPDFGSFSGNSDYGSSSRSSSSSSSSRSSSSSSSGGYSSTTRRSYSTGSDYGALPYAGVTSRHNYSSSSSTDDETEDMIAGAVFILLILFFVWKWMSAKKHRHGEPVDVYIEQPVVDLRPMSEYPTLDPEFDETRITDMLANLYVQMQETWQAKDINPIRPYMTDKFFAQMNNQLEQFRKSGRTDYTENISVLNVGLKGWRQSAGMDYITATLNSRIVSYVLDDRTGKLLSGDRKREKFMQYEIDLCRKSGTLTTENDTQSHAAVCPHCGAPINLNASAKCEYCGSVITSVNIEWAVCAMRGISQRTV